MLELHVGRVPQPELLANQWFVQPTKNKMLLYVTITAELASMVLVQCVGENAQIQTRHAELFVFTLDLALITLWALFQKLQIYVLV